MNKIDRKLYTGPKGGQYWLDDNGKKHYVKSGNKKEPKVQYVLDETPSKKVKHTGYYDYTFRAYFTYDEEDGEWLHTCASSQQEAEDILMHDHWGITRLDLYEVEEITN